ncbi:hypothetical protein IJ182_05245 [bacterium]|nr:hypothetical protein [bacterium]
MKINVNDEKELGFIALLFTSIVLFIYSFFFFQDNLNCPKDSSICTFSHQSVLKTNTVSIPLNFDEIKGIHKKRIFLCGRRKATLYFVDLADNRRIEIPQKIYEDYKLFIQNQKEYEFNSSSIIGYNILLAILFLIFAISLKISKK